MTQLLTEALHERGYDTLTPVQEAVTDPALAEADLLVSAQTGSGKTVGFGLAIAPTLLGDADRFGPAAAPLALVVAPTRELAFQVMRELEWLYARTGARVASCVGGMDMRDERRALDRGAHIVVGTPGRLRDHIERGSLDMTGLRAVVLDEADEMLDLGFREDLEFMLGEAPAERRTLLFSATVSPVIAKLAEQYQRDARRVTTLGGAKQHADISYQAVRVAAADREHAIFNLLRFHDSDSAIVFANTRAAVNHLTARLANRGFSVVILSGELSQSERTHALQAMRDGRARICVATDVAARGIDLPNLGLVIHADLPTNTESLLHRSGRTGRAGRKGISALIVPPAAVKKTERLLKWAKIQADWIAAPTADEILRRDEEKLLNDPAWAEAPSDTETAFADRLLERHAPRAIAAAYLRLYRSRQSAPEDLLPADTPAPKKERKGFDRSAWFALSVGRGDRAEPRWLLPLLCRAGNLDKAAIGAIRVQDQETFVELQADSGAGFLDAIGADATLEDGIKVRALDSPPALAPARGPRPDTARPSKPPRPSKPAQRHGDAPAKPPRKPRNEGAAHGSEKPASRGAPAPRHTGPAPKTAISGHGEKRGNPKPPNREKPKGSAGKKPAFAKPKGKPRETADARDASKRFSPPGKPKPGARKARTPGGGAKPRSGGNEPPRRGKR